MPEHICADRSDQIFILDWSLEFQQAHHSSEFIQKHGNNHLRKESRHYARALHAFVLKEAITTGAQHFFIEGLGVSDPHERE